MKRNNYPTDVTDLEWEIIKEYIPKAKPGGRPEKYPKREIINGVFYLVRSGCAWRMLPHDLPTWRIVYYYYRRWSKDGTWQRINDKLRARVRLMEGKLRQPSAAILDAQSVKTTEKGGCMGMTPTRESMVEKGSF